MALITGDGTEVSGALGVAAGERPAFLPAGDIATSTPGRPRYCLGLSDRRALLVTGDLLALAAALSLWLLVRPGAAHAAPQVTWCAALVGIWLFVAAVTDAYDLRTAARRPGSIIRACRAAAVSVGLCLVGPVVSAPLVATGRAALALALSWTLFLIGWRAAYAWLACRPELRTRVLVVGAGSVGKAIVEAIRGLGGAYEVVGVVDRGTERLGSTVGGAPVLGVFDDLSRILERRHVDEVVLADLSYLQGGALSLALNALDGGISVARAADVYEVIARRTLVSSADQCWLDVLPHGATSGLVHTLYRRALDLAFAVPGALALALILPFAALAIRLDSPGPIFYSQERVGKHGRRFRIAKLRSMYQDAEAPGEAIWARPGDRRITRVGKVLRKTRLDELPQLLSILRGDMSLVGPRPERPEFVGLLERRIPCYRARLAVRPGLTGWAQVMYRYGSTVEDARVKLEYDLYYIRHQSPLLDALTLVKTVGIVLRCKGT